MITSRTWSKRLYTIGVIILLLGLSSAVPVYLTADSGDDNDAGYQVVGKNMYPGMHIQSKKYMHDLELYGGKAAVLADEFNRWFEELWYGQTLAFTIAGLSILLALGFFTSAHLSSSGISADIDAEIDKKT